MNGACALLLVVLRTYRAGSFVLVAENVRAAGPGDIGSATHIERARLPTGAAPTRLPTRNAHPVKRVTLNTAVAEEHIASNPCRARVQAGTTMQDGGVGAAPKHYAVGEGYIAASQM